MRSVPKQATNPTRDEVLVKLPERMRAEVEAAFDMVVRDNKGKGTVRAAQIPYRGQFTAIKQIRRHLQKRAPRFRSASGHPMDRQVEARFTAVLSAVDSLEREVTERMLGEGVAMAVMNQPLGARTIPGLLLSLRAEHLIYRDMAVLFIDYPASRGQLPLPYRRRRKESRDDAIVRLRETLKTLAARAAKAVTSPVLKLVPHE